MNTLLVLAAALAVASASVVPVAPLASTAIVEGPSSSAQVVGPDGSVIVAANPAGRIVASENVGVGAVGYSAPVVPAVAPVVSAYSAPVVSAYHAAFVGRALVASPLTASGYSLFAAGSGLEGQWIPDINEKLYDDGSYKGEIY
ncbi:dna-directed rna polymerase ii iii [Holotrichia oblita]|uniref:Dna-directed rna polymerase ii iii n=1 Tax=Holotrichia oblita TaxID=644536 RepID=A0ACB9TDH7_HOLOL|nr:dna-directed rna polymerase ii iii [Holotrichia oblita]